jgi:hypothetical protein
VTRGLAAVVVKIWLPVPVAAIARQRAEAAEVPVSRWAAEVIEAFVAGERCQQQHAAPSTSPLPLSGDREADEAE